MTLRWKTRVPVFEVLIVGHGGAEFGPALIRRQDAQLAEAGSLNLFYDFSGMPTYDSELRVACTKWIQAHASFVPKIHVVVRSKMVAMGVSVANLALGGIIQTYTQRTGAFEKALANLSR